MIHRLETDVYAVPDFRQLRRSRIRMAYGYIAFYGLLVALWILLSDDTLLSRRMSIAAVIGAVGLSSAAALAMVTLAQHWTVGRQRQSLTVHSLYDIDIPPQRAAMVLRLSDGAWTRQEIVDQLIKKHALTLASYGDRVELQFHDISQSNFEPHELVLLRDLARGRQLLTHRELYEGAAVRRAEAAIFKSLHSEGYIEKRNYLQQGFYEWASVGMVALTGVSLFGFLPLVLLSSDVSIRLSQWTIGYLTPWFLLLVALSIGIPLLFASVKTYTQTGLQQYRKVAGLYSYLHTVYQNRTSPVHLSEREQQFVLPYLEAFDIDDGHYNTSQK